MSFQVPYSSSPPSTPNRKSNNLFSYGSNNPSTTPAGPPPSSAGSFTPAGPPPSSFLGSSMLGNSVKPLSFGQQTPSLQTYGSSKPNPAAGFTPSHSFYQQSGLVKGPIDSRRRSFGEPLSSGEEEDEEDYTQEEQDYGRADHDVEVAVTDDEDNNYDNEMDGYQSSIADTGSNPHGYARSNSNLLRSTQENFGRNMLKLKGSTSESLSEKFHSVEYAQIAKDLYSDLELSTVSEADDIILKTEALVTRLYEEGIESSTNDDMLENALSIVSQELTKLWGDYERTISIHNSEEYNTRIGPSLTSPDFAKANFLAGLALQIHHPQFDHDSYESSAKPLPEVMLTWMDNNHDPYPSHFEEIQAHRPSPSHHSLFWDVVFNSLLRGKVVAVVKIMKEAGWQHSRGGSDDIRDQKNGQIGYTGVTLSNVEQAVAAATRILEQCPAFKGDWNIRSSDWTLFRLRCSQAKDELREFAEGGNPSRPDSYSQSGAYSKTSQRAQSRVPWHIYQNLLTLYNFALGDKDAIIANAQDWCEATVGLLAWWDDGKEDRRVALGKSKTTYRMSSRSTDAGVFSRKLGKAFDLATAESTELNINTLDPIEVGLASLLEGDIRSVLGFLRIWSGPLSSAVAEIGTLGGWLPPDEAPNLITMGTLDEDDLGVLGIVGSPSKSDGVKDQTLIDYARALVRRGELRSAEGFEKTETIRHGWELAISVLGRLDSATRSEEMVGEVLRTLKLDSADTVNKVWRNLNAVGLGRLAETTAENYANNLAEGSHKYGEALWYYALSQKANKVKDVLDLLISYSLIQSVAYPTEPEMDNHLSRLIHFPKSALLELSSMDIRAAELLHKMLSGYATLRRFYALRDEGVASPIGGSLQKATRARRAEAISVLMVVIASSDDNVRGGIYDENRGAVVSVDFILALLGESMAFVNQSDSVLTVSDIDTLLRAIEDIQAVGPRVYSACTDFLQTVIASGQGLKGSSPADMLRKSTSNLSGTSSFSMVGSSMLASQLKQSMGSSGVLVKGNVKRGWDWRQTISAGTSAEDLLRILRLGLAKDLARAWLSEADNMILPNKIGTLSSNRNKAAAQLFITQKSFYPMMRRAQLPISALPAWCKLNDVSLLDIEVRDLGGYKGCGLTTSRTLTSETDTFDISALILVPPELVLSRDAIEEHAKVDRHFRHLLDVAGRKSLRGDILLFLLLQVTIGSVGDGQGVGVSNPWTEYVKFLPDHVPLPTLWTEEERIMLLGTSLEAALNAKQASLLREYEALRDLTAEIDWCHKYLWANETFDLNDWTLLDAWFRSRSLELPGAGESMIPCIDMVNHFSSPNSYFEPAANGGVNLLLRPGERIQTGVETTISYGTSKSGAEMLFSYGFIDDISTTKSLILPLEPFPDDPLGKAKLAAFSRSPHVRIFSEDDHIVWEGPFLYLMCINEEDGLEFRILQQTDGSTSPLRTFWQGTDVSDTTDKFQSLISDHPLQDVFKLRAVALLQDHVQASLERLFGSQDTVESLADAEHILPERRKYAMGLRRDETAILEGALAAIELQKTQLFESDAVLLYLGSMDVDDAQAEQTSNHEDFS